MKELRASLETINQTASELITDIDRHFAEICKERGIDPKAQTALPETPEPVEATMPERVAELERQNAMLTECLLEMSGIVYG